MILRERIDVDYALIPAAEHANLYVPVLCSRDKTQVIGLEGLVFSAVLNFLKILIRKITCQVLFR